MVDADQEIALLNKDVLEQEKMLQAHHAKMRGTAEKSAQVQQQAAQSGMQRIVPSSYVQGTQVAIDLTAPVGASPTDMTPLWLRAVAIVVNTVVGTRDVQAATKH